jgi:hypothetical protein
MVSSPKKSSGGASPRRSPRGASPRRSPGGASPRRSPREKQLSPSEKRKIEEAISAVDNLMKKEARAGKKYQSGESEKGVLFISSKPPKASKASKARPTRKPSKASNARPTRKPLKPPMASKARQGRKSMNLLLVAVMFALAEEVNSDE